MSRLAHQGDDYPEASKKHLDDAIVLDREGRYDGSVYHAGYVVECAFKTLLLFELAWNPRTGQYEPRKLDRARIRLTELSHGLQDLLEELRRLNVDGTTHSAPYLPRLAASAPIMQWRPSHRYRPPGHRRREPARAMLQDARQIYDQTIARMMNDQVL